MHKRILTFALFSLLSLSVFAQSETPIKQESRLRLGIILPTLSIETPLFKDTSLKFGVIGGFRVGSSVPFEIIPTFFIEPRFYLTADLRRKHDKRTDFFSGGYLTVHTSSTTIDNKSLGVTGLIYGTQGNIGRKGIGYYDFGLGLGYIFNDEALNTNVNYSPLLRLDLGIRLK